MSFNGDGSMTKRQRLDDGGVLQRDHSDYSKTSYEPRRKRPEADPNNVLLFTIINPVYPITVDVLHTICTPHGQVVRIVIFKKNGVQAMVEFESIDTAKRVKEALNGADIYSGCCTLKIEFAKPTKLNVYKNDMESWDYTIPGGNDKPPEHPPTRQAPLLQEPRFGAPPQLYHGGPPPTPGRGRGGPSQPPYIDYDEGGYTNGRPSAYGDYVNDRYPHASVDNRWNNMVKPGGREGGGGGGGGSGLVPSPAPPGGPRGPGGGPGYTPGMTPSNGVQGGTGCVMMAYGLDPAQANPDKLFNLFCLYGNVIRIKFLKTKEGCAMVQMGDSVSVERCINHLKNTPIFGGVLQLGFSKQTYLSEVAQPYSLPDNSPSFKDYTGSKNNRFVNPNMASKNRIQAPAKILHFFNTPPDISEDHLMTVIEEKGVKKPSQVKLFPKKGDRSSSGLMEFENLEDAVNCLVNCNHLPIKNAESKFPYMMKLCFSSSRSLATNGPMKEE